MLIKSSSSCQNSAGAQSALVGLQEEVGEDLTLLTEYVTSDTSVEDMKSFFEKSSPERCCFNEQQTVTLCTKNTKRALVKTSSTHLL